MVLRGADYARKPHRDYRAPAEPVLALIPHLVDIPIAWVPSDRGGNKVLAATPRAHGIETASTNFLTVREAPAGADAVVDNPPFGRGGRLAVAFIEHCAVRSAVVAGRFRLRARSRGPISRQPKLRRPTNPAADCLVCERTSEPSANHMWAIWDAGRDRCSPPIVHYEAESNLPARRRRHPSLVATNASGRGVTAVASSKGPNDHE